MKSKFSRGFGLIVICFSAVALTSSLHAQTATWNNTGTDFNTGANWTGGTGPGGIPGPTDIATFATPAVTNPVLSAPLTIQGLAFSTATSSGYTISSTGGAALTIAGNAAVAGANTSGVNTISADLILGAAAGTVTFTEGQTGFGPTQGASLILSGNISSTNAITGINLGGNSSGIVYTLSGNNSYSGTTTMGFVSLNINSNTALGTGNLVVGNHSRLNNTSGSAVTVANGITVNNSSFIFMGTTAANDLTFNGLINLSNQNSTIAVNGGGRLTFGTGGVNWGGRQTSLSTDDGGNGGNGLGTLVLNGVGTGTGAVVTLGTVSYTSTLRITTGTIEINNAAALGPAVNTTSGVLQLNGGSLQAGSALAFANTSVLSANSIIGGMKNIELTGAFIQNNTGSRTLSVTNTGTTKLSGIVSISDLATSSLTFNVNVGAAAGTTEISGVIQNTTTVGTGIGSFAKSGAGNLVLSGANTYTGGTLVQEGSLIIVGSLSNSSVITLGNSTGNTSGKLVLGSAGGAVNQTSSGITTAGTGTANAIVGGSAVASTLTISNTAAVSYGGLLGGAGTSENNLNLTKTSIGDLTLTGNGTYTGATTVSGGSLILGGAGSINGSPITINGGGAKFIQNSSVAGTSPITVTNGTLMGLGSVGVVTVGAGTGGIVANGNGALGNTSKLTMAALTFNGAGTLNLQLAGGAVTTEALTVTGALTTLGGADSVSINLLLPTTPFGNATYNLIGYGSFTGNLSAFKITSGLTPRQSGVFGNTGSAITLTITGDAPKWTGADNGNWIVGATGPNSNWRLITAGTPTNYIQGDSVLFDDTATGSTTVNISSANVTPSSTTFNNSTKDYTLTGNFGIAGSGPLTKNGTGKLTIQTSNSYTGPTAVNAGTLNIQNNSALGSSTIVTVASGAALEFEGGITVNARPLTINGAGLAALPVGALRNVSGSNIFAGLITLGGNSTIQSDAGSLALTNTGIITGSGFGLTLAGAGNGSIAGVIGTGAGTVTKTGAGTWTLAGANNYTGLTTVNGGTLTLTGVNTFTGAITINSGVLTIGGAGQLGTGTYAGAITNNGSFIYSSTANQTLSGIISGTGTLVLNGTTGGGPLTVQTPTLTLTQANTYSGGTTINGGMLSIVGGNAAGLGTGTVTVNGGNFLFGNNMTVANNFVLSGGGIYAKDGTNVISGSLVINAGSTTSYIGGRYDSKTFNISGEVSGSGNVTIANVDKALIGDNNAFQGSNVHFSNANVSTYNGTVTIANDGFTSLYIDSATALANATINVSNATGNVNNGLAGKPFVFGNGLTAATIGGLSSGTAVSGFGNVGLVNTAGGALALSVGTNNTNQTFAGVLSGAGSLIKIGTGTQTLTGANTYTGTTTINGGKLLINGSNGPSLVTVNSGGALGGTGSVGGLVTVAGSGGIDLRDSSVGTLTLSGGLTLNNGNQLFFDIGTSAGSADRIVVGGTYTFTAGTASVTLNALGTAVEGSYTLISGATGLNSSSYLLSGPPPVGLNAALTSAGDGTLILVLSPSGAGSTTAYWKGGAANTFAPANFAPNPNGTGSLAPAVINGDTDVIFSATSPAPVAATATLTEDQIVKSLRINSAQTASVNIAGAFVLTINGGLTVEAGAGALTLSTNQVNVGAIQSWTNNSANAVTVSSVISGNGLLLTGTGGFVFTGANTYNDTTINGTTLSLVGAGSLLDTGAVGLVSTGATLNISGITAASETIGTLAGQTGTSIILGARNLVVNQAANATYSGVISGTGGFTKNGAGTLIVDGNNTYTGTTTIGAGILQVGTGGTAGSIGTGAVANNGTLTVNRSDAYSIAGNISGSGAFIKDGAGTTSLTGSNTYTGTTTINAGTLRATTLGTGLVSVNNGGAVGNLVSGTPLTVNSINFAAGSSANLFLNGGLDTTTPGIVVTDGITTPGTGSGGVTLNLVFGTTTGGTGITYEVISFAGGTFTGVATDFVIGAGTSGLDSGQQLVVGSDADSIYVTVAGGVLNWTGEEDGIWTTEASGTPNGPLTDWETVGGIPQEFTALTVVNFSDSSANTSVVINDNDVVPGSVTFNNSTDDYTISGTAGIAGVGTLTKNGTGSLTIGNANSYTGGTVVNGGTVIAALSSALGTGTVRIDDNPGDGSTLQINSGVTINNLVQAINGGLVTGLGTIGGNLDNTSGIVSPGINSLGTLTTNGNYTQGSDGRLIIDTLGSGDSDLLIVGGIANLGGTLEINFGAGAGFGSFYTFLDASTLTGDGFSDIVSSNSDFRIRLVYDTASGDVSFLIAPNSFTQVALTPNQQQVAGALDNWIDNPGNTADMNSVTSALDMLTVDQFPAAFDAISPGLHSGALSLASSLSQSTAYALHQNLSARSLNSVDYSDAYAGDYLWDLWGQATGYFNDQDINLTQGQDFESGTYLVGANRNFSHTTAIGFFGGYGDGSADYDNGSEVEFERQFFGGYLTYRNGSFYANAAVGGGSIDYDSKRRIQFGIIDRTADGSTSGDEIFAVIGAGYDFKVGDFSFGPQASLQHSKVSLDGFEEKGADSLNLGIDDTEYTSLRSLLGGRAAYTIQLDSPAALVPFVHAFWQHEFEDSQDDMGASLAGGAGPAFSYAAETPDADAFIIGAGLSVDLGETFQATFSYNLGTGDSEGDTMTGTINWKF